MIYLTQILISVVALVLVYVSFSIFGKTRKYYRKEKRLSEIEDKYERLRNSRRDFLHHMYWARSNEEHKRADQLEQDVFNIDDQLESLKEEFDLVMAGKEVPLKTIPGKQL